MVYVATALTPFLRTSRGRKTLVHAQCLLGRCFFFACALILKTRLAGFASTPRMSSARTLKVYLPGARCLKTLLDLQGANFGFLAFLLDFAFLPWPLLFFGFGLTSMHWKPVIAPGALNLNVALFFFESILALSILVPVGTPKVAVTVWSVSSLAWQIPVPVHGPENPAKLA